MISVSGSIWSSTVSTDMEKKKLLWRKVKWFSFWSSSLKCSAFNKKLQIMTKGMNWGKKEVEGKVKSDSTVSQVIQVLVIRHRLTNDTEYILIMNNFKKPMTQVELI